jgi:MSHA biogenesis protein MshP
MTHPLTNPAGRASNRGFAIVSAIFLIVVLAALGVGMLVFSRAQQSASANDVQGSRAYQAARAGIEWALFRRVNPINYVPTNDPTTNKIPSYCQLSTNTPPYGASLQTGSTMTYVNVPNSETNPTNLALSAPTLSQFTVTIVCNVTVSVPDVNNVDYLGNPVKVVVRQITATACNQPASGVTACPNANHGLDYVQRKLQVDLQQID